MNREEILNKSLALLKENNYRGTIVLTMGTGKSILSQNVIKEIFPTRVLIVTPRNLLNESWINTLNNYLPEYTNYNIVVKTIKSIYNNPKEYFDQFDLFIFDECHTIDEAYFKPLSIIDKDAKVILLTGTPNKELPFKKNVLYKEFPILIEYYDAQKDGITNKINTYVIQYELSDRYKVESGSTLKRFMVGEKKQYKYLTERYDRASKRMFNIGSTNLISDSIAWLKSDDKEVKSIASEFIGAMNSRRRFLQNLSSSIAYTKLIISNIQKYSNNKILTFHESVESANKISPYSVHGKNPKEYNKELLTKFNNGDIPVLSSVNSLTMGINLVNAKYSIFESFNGSYTSVSQKLHRLSRLNPTDHAVAFFVVPKDTQSSVWMDSNQIDYKIISLLDIKNVL